MDSLPSELVSNVLSFLPGEDVDRFKQLNSRFRENIVKNRNYLQFPELLFQLTDYDSHRPNMCSVAIRMKNLHYIGIMYDINESKFLHSEFFSRVENETYLEALFGDIFEHDIGSMFTMLQEKAEIILSLSTLDNPRIIETLTCSINKTTPRIKHITVDLQDNVLFPSTCMLLTAVATRSKCRPSFDLDFLSLGKSETWSQIVELNNDIAPDFKAAFIKYGSSTANQVFVEIAQNFVAKPIDNFNFFLRAYSQHESHRRMKDTVNLDNVKDFNVTKVRPRRFHFFDKKDLESSISLVNSRGLGVQFSKVRGQLKPRPGINNHDEIDIQIKIIHP